MKENTKSNIKDTILESEELTQMVKEATKNSLKTLLGDAVRDYMNESILKEADESKDDEYEVEDVDNNTSDETTDNEMDSSDTLTDDSETEDDDTTDDESDDTVLDGDDTESSDDTVPTDIDSEDNDEWSEFDQYKTGDDMYDFTGVEDDDTIVKVYKLLNDDDQVVIKQDNDKINIKDNETGAEYVIELDADGMDDSKDLSIDDSSSDDDSLLDDDDDSMNEGIDLGYTDNYQDVDPLTNDGMTEPADKSATSDWDKGVPSGTKKPWAGKGDNAPYDDKITEEDEAMQDEDNTVEEVTTVTSNNARKMPKTHTSEPRRKNLPYGSKHISASGKYDDSVVEKIIKKAKAIQEENKRYKYYLNEVKNRFQDAVVVNVSLGQIVKLFSENTTSRNEKKSIIERFSNVKTVKESKLLYETITNELNKEQKSPIVLEKQMASTSSKINETPVYQSKDIMETLDLIRRMDKLNKNK